MSNRNYNVFFHLHTVSGISISVGLFVIFFAGAFALFRNEIGEWESGEYHEKRAAAPQSKTFDFNRLMDSVAVKSEHLYGREFYIYESGNQNYSVYASASADTTLTEKENKALEFKVDSAYKLKAEAKSFSFGELLYLLHFYYQLDRPGYYLAGFVALIFFFAIVTGILVHWKKIVSNFFMFRPKTKLKTVWTDAHTALGVIGIPFQFLYALTGSMFGLGVIVSSFNAMMIYNGDADKMYQDIQGEKPTELGKEVWKEYDFNAMAEQSSKKWDCFHVNYLHIKNYGSSSMTVSVEGEQSITERFLGKGEVLFDGNTGKILREISPENKSFYDKIWASVFRLHYADFGEIGSLATYLLKMVYFLLAFLTCFVIITGVLIWMEARNKKGISPRRMAYNTWVGRIYLSSSLSLFPITAACFILSKLLGSENSNREMILNYSFFYGWLLLTILFILKKDNYLTNKYCLIATGVLGWSIPFVNGFSSGNWLWRSAAQGHYGVFMIDFLWIFIGLICIYITFRLKTAEGSNEVETSS